MGIVEKVFWKLQQMDLRPRKCGVGYSALCPVHEADGKGHQPSLTFAAGSTQPLVITCHAGCSLTDILRALDLTMADILNEAEKMQEAARPSKQVVVEKDVARWVESLFDNGERFKWIEQNRYLEPKAIVGAEIGWNGKDYTIPVRDAKGRLLFVKTYNPDRDPQYKMPEGSRVALYGAEKLAALPDGALVILCEGEFDALVCRSMDYAAVTTTSGANSWRSEWAKLLRRFEVVVIGDNDIAGREYTKRALRDIRNEGGYAQQLIWPTDTPDKEDPTSFVKRAGSDALRQLILDAQYRGHFKRIEIEDLFTTEVEPIPWVIEGWLAEQDIGILGGEAGAGKSMVLLDLAISLALGRPFLRHLDVHNGPWRVLFVDEENNQRLCRRRLQQFIRGAKADNGELKELNSRFRYLTDNFMNLDDEGIARRFRREVRTFKPHWILLDSLVRFHGRDENSNTAMAQFYRERLKPVARDFGCGMQILHHLSKPSKDRPQDVGHRLRGASDLRGIVDELWGLEGDAETNERTMRHEKCRWEMLSSPLRMRYETNEDGTIAWLQGGDETEQAEEVIVRALASCERVGALRVDIVNLLRDEGFKSADRVATSILRKMLRAHRVQKKREGKAVRYWFKEFAQNAQP